MIHFFIENISLFLLKNISDTEVSFSYPSQYSQHEIIMLAIITSLMMIIVVVGNMLVIIAIATEHTLNTVQNWFIASLAFADLSLGLIIMPFSLAYEVVINSNTKIIEINKCICLQSTIFSLAFTLH